jgi:glutamine amidotransferase
MTTVALIDYGMGNLRSVRNALEVLGATAFIASTEADLQRADRAILPGVGAFGDAMKNLHERGWVRPLTAFAMDQKKPFLGICLGMQLLAKTGTEFGEHEGLGWFDGAVRKLAVPAEVRVPHMGWNDVTVLRSTGLLQGVAPKATCYFVHSFAFEATDPTVVTGTTEYGGTTFVSVIERENVFGAQFHPEKSQKHGLAILKRFLEL